MQSQDPNEIVRLVTAPNPADAHIWEQALQREGIKCQVVGDYLAAGLGDVPGILPEIWVRRADAARAQKILEQTLPRSVEEENPAE